jgi:hypothetical protein
MEDLVRYLNEIVEPTVKDLEGEPTSVRKAFLTCVAVFHAIDYLAYPRKSGNLKKLWREKSADFALVDDVAHAFKHVVTRGPNHLKAREVISRPPAFYGEVAWDLSRWDDPAGGVTLEGDRTIDVLDVIRRAVAFLREQATHPPKPKDADRAAKDAGVRDA